METVELAYPYVVYWYHSSTINGRTGDKCKGNFYKTAAEANTFFLKLKKLQADGKTYQSGHVSRIVQSCESTE